MTRVIGKQYFSYITMTIGKGILDFSIGILYLPSMGLHAASFLH